MSELPGTLITNIETKAVTLAPEVESSIPSINQAFAEADQAFLANPEKYFRNLRASVFTFKSTGGADVACSLLYRFDSKGDEALVLHAPFADRDPKSSAQELNEYTTRKAAVGFLKKEHYAPNSWNQITKSAAIFEVLGALGKNIPVLTIFGPVPTHAYSSGERKRFKQGDFSPAGRLTQEALKHAQDILHGPSSETRLTHGHISGASLGASNAIGAAASRELGESFDVETVTAQELILGPRNLRDLGKRFILGSLVGEASDETVSASSPKIEETALRRTIDAHGSEIIGMNGRALQGMSKLPYMKGLTEPEATVRATETLLDNNVSLLIALAENSLLTHHTPYHLPGTREKVITIRGENGQKIGHLADEHVALSALITALNISDNS